MNLKDLKDHLVDLRRSEYDAARSEPKNGQYMWVKKVYLRSKDYKDDQTRPDYIYRWVAFDEDQDFMNFNHWRLHYGAESVDYKNTEVYPEPLVPTVDGNYRFMDMILMRIPLTVWMEKVEADHKRYDKAREGLDKKFRADAAKEGAVFEGEILPR